VTYLERASESRFCVALRVRANCTSESVQRRKLHFPWRRLGMRAGQLPLHVTLEAWQYEIVSRLIVVGCVSEDIGSCRFGFLTYGVTGLPPRRAGSRGL
jgi:hypothetical protein